MKADKQKLEIAMARACANANDIAQCAGMPQPTVKNAIAGRNVKPRTLGRIAKALGVDAADLIESEA